MIEDDAGAVMSEVERMVVAMYALADRARDTGDRTIAILARDASEALLALLDALAAAERGASSPNGRSDGASGRRAVH